MQSLTNTQTSCLASPPIHFTNSGFISSGPPLPASLNLPHDFSELFAGDRFREGVSPCSRGCTTRRRNVRKNWRRSGRVPTSEGPLFLLQ
eukprot:8575780-Alexandrium_andersonii.AAC.1